MMSTAVPVSTLLAAYSLMFRLSLANRYWAKYTYWVYVEVLLLVPIMFVYPLARNIALVNSLGLGLGVHCMYAATNYGALRDFGDQWGLQGSPFAALLLGDFVVHLLPWGVLQLAFSDEFALAFSAPRLSTLWIGVMTGFLHSTYTHFLGLGFDPGPVYNIVCAYKTRDVYLAWIGLFFSHIFATTVIVRRDRRSIPAATCSRCTARGTQGTPPAARSSARRWTPASTAFGPPHTAAAASNGRTSRT